MTISTLSTLMLSISTLWNIDVMTMTFCISTFWTSTFWSCLKIKYENTIITFWVVLALWVVMPFLAKFYRILQQYLCDFCFFLLKLSLWSMGRVDGSQSKGPWFDHRVRRKLLYHIPYACSRITSYIARSRGLPLWHDWCTQWHAVWPLFDCKKVWWSEVKTIKHVKHLPLRLFQSI